MRMLTCIFGLIVMSAPAATWAQSAERRAEWNADYAPFRITGNLYYVGTGGLSAFLITGPRGHVLIDGGLPESAPLIARNIQTLGFKLSEVKYLLINHAHLDHAGGLAALKQLTGARLVASKADTPDLELGETIGRRDIDGFPPVKVDRTIRDKEKLRLGPITLQAVMTPGHTRGATSWLTTIGGKRVLFASSISTADQNLVNDPTYPNAVQDFRNTFAKLRAMRADIFLNFHTEGFDMETKRTRQKAGANDAFVDAGELQRRVDQAEVWFEEELARQRAAAQ